MSEDGGRLRHDLDQTGPTNTDVLRDIGLPDLADLIDAARADQSGRPPQGREPSEEGLEATYRAFYQAWKHDGKDVYPALDIALRAYLAVDFPRSGSPQRAEKAVEAGCAEY